MSGGEDIETRYRSRLVKAATALRELEERTERLQRERTEPIAVIGMGCRFPGGADDPEALWHLLSEGTDTVSERPTQSAVDAVRWGAFLSGTDAFDAAFFGISPREAERLDPQQRLLLEVAWDALEDAGVVPRRLSGTDTGVFVGMSTNDYLLLSAEAGARDGHTGTGTTHCFGPGRLSYTLGLRGPSMAVDTACSSSLVAVHLAVQSLRSGESSLALAGGVNLILTDSTTKMVADLQALSPDGRCRTFDARADGFVRGEGCGVVVLKRLSDAVADNDRVLATLRGSAVNSDGRSAGLIAPNPAAQRAVLHKALTNAGVRAADIGYVETHGTGTALGDPIEIEALTEVLAAPRPDGSRCVLGAVKTNIGHLEAAAGIAGLIKVVLALRHQEIPGNLHFSTLNPRISLSGTPFEIPRGTVPWTAGDTPRLAGVSSFGMSGTNAHVVVAEPPQPEPAESADGPVLLPLSARTPKALTELARAYADYLEQADDLRDVAYTCGVRREHHEQRLAVVGESAPELAEALRAVTVGPKATDRPTVTYVFSGQGAGWAGMATELLATEPVFAAALEECDALIARHASFSLLEELTEHAGARLTEIAQPVLFGVQVALAALLSSWGVEPDAVIGHSVGEVAAAHTAGALSLPEAARLVALRGRAMAGVGGAGAMTAVALGPAEVSAALSGMDTDVVVAAVNDARSVVLSGAVEELVHVVQRLRAQGARCRELDVDYAFHSPMMTSPAERLAQDLGTVEASTTKCPLYSTVRGEQIAGGELTGRYWAANVRQPVRFADAVQAAHADGHGVFLEVAPHPVLSGHIRDALGAATVIPTLRRDQPETRGLLGALGALYTSGHPVDFARLYPERRRVVSLPAYRWQRERHWLDVPPAQRGATVRDRPDPLLGTRLDVAGTLAVFDAEWTAAADEGSVSSAVRAAAEAALDVGTVRVSDLTVRGKLSTPCHVQLVVTASDDAAALVTVYARADEGDWRPHASGRVAAESPGSWPEELLALPEAGREAVVVAAVCTDVATVLGLSSPLEARADQPLMEIGLDSLMTVQLRHELSARTGWALPATLAFDHPTPRAIARYLLGLLVAEETEDGTP
ncbi:type I polyketide synthase [Streptomyces sp. 3N207]|uniref:type I polyketide synthase n=1 Tax=Streptomyces sp. 3N207 TaxID=3457417 RepID=UPI003FD0662C